MRWRSILSTATLSVVAVLCVVVAASCQFMGTRKVDDAEDLAARKLGYGQLRTDPEPLTQRFALLRMVREVRWMSGLYGQRPESSTSTYWIDAVITLDASQMANLNRTYGPTQPAKRPKVVYGMRERLPAGPFLTGAALNAAFKQGSWSAQVYLASNSNKLVLLATGT